MAVDGFGTPHALRSASDEPLIRRCIAAPQHQGLKKNEERY